ncbi:MAG: hypothetical protein K8R77_11235 [Anaerolineaceae bacterium]|nr:hypothetical protein [Anaerolineaceae bacterium]
MKTIVRKSLPNWSTPLALLVLCVLSYSLLSPSLGFNWDDWLQLLVNQHLGKNAFWAYFAYDRPTSAWTHILLMPILGENPTHWQIFTMLMRWLAAVNIWWCFSSMWPKYRRQATMTAMLFAVYPVFTQQAISLAYHQHLLQYALFTFSLAVMVKAIRSPKRFWLFTILALLTEILQLTITEFYCGVELIRPILLWILLKEKHPANRTCLKKTLAHWWPYLLPLAAYTLWRLFILEFPIPEPHSLELVSVLRSAPLKGLAQLARFALTDTLYILFGSWQGPLSLNIAQPVSAMTFFSWGIGLLAGAVVIVAFRHRAPQEQANQVDKPERTWFIQAIIIGLLITILGPLPIWLTGSQAIGDIHANRFALGSMFGASLLITALIEWAAKPGQHTKAIMLALIIGLTVSFHVRVSDEYRVQQANFRSFFWQLSWRAPHLKPKTALIARDETYPTQLSTVASALNLAYPAPQSEPQNLNYWAYRVQPEADPASELPGSFQNQYRTFYFNASAENSLVLHKQLDGRSCLWVLREIDQYNPDVPENLRSFLPLSNLMRIQDRPLQESYPPAVFFGEPPADDWCCLFEKAELAVQEADWAEMAGLLKTLEEMSTEPNPGSAREWLPFIEGYAHTGGWDKALALTQQTAKQNPAYAPMFCQLWIAIEDHTPANPEQKTALQTITHELDCNPVY